MSRWPSLLLVLACALLVACDTPAPPAEIAAPATPSPAAVAAQRPALGSDLALTMQEYSVPPGSGPYDVAPAPDGMVW